MNITASYDSAGSIYAVIDGVEFTVPDDMSNRHRQMIAEWEGEGGIIAQFVPPAPMIAEVKAEAARRIEAIMPDYKQRNVMAWGLETMMVYGTDPADWPAQLRAVNDQAQAAWAAIKAIRVRSDEIEAMQPIPADFVADHYWAATA